MSEKNEEIEIDIIYDEDGSLHKFLDDIEEAANDPFAKNAPDERIEKLHSQDGAGRQTKEKGAVSNYGLYKVAEPNWNQKALSKLYELCGPNGAAIDAKVSNIVGLGHRWVESRKTKEALEDIEDEERLAEARRTISETKGELDELLEHANEHEHFLDILEEVVTDYEATGNAYMEVGRTVNGDIGYVGRVAPETMRVRKSRDGFVQIIGDSVTFFRNFGDQSTPDPIRDRSGIINEIIHFKNYTTADDFYGVPDIIKAQEEMAGNKFAAQYNLEYFERKAVPRYALIVKGAKLSEDAEKKLIEYFRNNVKGKHHGTLYIPVPQGENGEVEVQLKAIETGTQEASFVAYFEMNRDAMFAVHRTPLTEVGIAGDVNNAMGQALAKNFKEKVVGPKQRYFERKLKPVFRELTDLVDFKLVELTLADQKTQAQIFQTFLRWDLMTINEIRTQKLGLSRVPWGDEPVGAVAENRIAEERNNDETSQRRREERAQRRRSRERDHERESGPDIDGENREPRGSEE